MFLLVVEFFFFFDFDLPLIPILIDTSIKLVDLCRTIFVSVERF